MEVDMGGTCGISGEWFGL